MRLSAELKVPPGGFRGGFPAKQACSNQESGRGVEV